MTFLRSALALVLSVCLGISPAAAQIRPIQVQVPPATAASAAAAARPLVVSAGLLSLAPNSLIAPAAIKAGFVAAPVGAALPLAVPVRPTAASLAAVAAAAEKTVAGLNQAGATDSSAQASAQFALLTEEPLAKPNVDDTTSVPVAAPAEGAKSSGLTAPKPAPPSPKGLKFTQVFRDPERNKAFWRYAGGYSVFLLGYQMYIVGLPYLVSSMTRNALAEAHDPRVGNEEAIKALIRSNRSLARIAHWGSQAVSYFTIPLFTKNAGTEGPGKLLSRAYLAHATLLAVVPVLFFSTGVLGLTTAFGLLLALFAGQAFFQGLSNTSEEGGKTRILGHPSVSADERNKANAILTFTAALFSIIAPAVAGEISHIGPFLEKNGVGGAVIYAIYAATTALTALIFASIKMLRGPAPESSSSLAAPAPTKGAGAVFKDLWTSIQDGARIVFKDRLLRTLLLISLVAQLFSDPLIFNVLPEYIESIVANNPSTIGAIMNVPYLGAFLKSLTSTPMGNFSLMMVMASVGSIVASMTITPLTKLFRKLGFKSEESLTIPFYALAALEAPLFLLMMYSSSVLPVVALYGLQSLAAGYIGIAIQGLYQKNLGGQGAGNINKVLSAQSLLSMAAAIVSTFAYGFLLKNIAIETSMAIAAVAMCATALLRLAAPFLAFSKESRNP